MIDWTKEKTKERERQTLIYLESLGSKCVDLTGTGVGVWVCGWGGGGGGGGGRKRAGQILQGFTLAQLSR